MLMADPPVSYAEISDQLGVPVGSIGPTRGRCLAQYAAEVVAASWDSVIFDVGRESLVRVPMMEPMRGTKAHVGRLIDECSTAAELLERLGT